MNSPEPAISIVGMACRLPGAHSTEGFWQLLLDGRDATGEPPRGRALTRRGGYLDDIDHFDNDWFAISAREAAIMDPQQRLALEVAVEAIDDAGIGYRVRGSEAAVVFGACGYDHGVTVLGDGERDAPYAVTGSALSIIANRLSYVLDLRGPSLVVDSACSSSLAAIDVATRLLADPSIPFAIVGGVNLTLLPHTSDYLADSGFLAEDGRCKPFDAAADGYTRGDGCGVLILRRAEDARRAGERVHAEIAGVAVGSDGRSNGLYAPNGRAQRDTVRAAWRRAGLDPRHAGYIECHGTGTALGDAVEVGALAAVLARAPEAAPIWIGSAKSNFGHLEAAAGVAGLIKAVLSVRHGIIPPTINFQAENPLLELDRHGLRVPTEAVDWSSTPVALRYAGVSSFGFGGTNAHVVVRGVAPVSRDRAQAAPVPIPVTGRDIADLRARAARLADLLSGPDEPTSRRDAEPLSAPNQPTTRRGTNLLSAPNEPTTRQGADPFSGTDRPTSQRGADPLNGPDQPTTPRNTDLVSAPDQPTTRQSTNLVSGTDQPASRRGADLPSGTDQPTSRRGADVMGGPDEPTLRQVAVAAARTMPEHVRAAVLAEDRDSAVDRLRGLAAGESGPGIIGPSASRRRGGLLFLFSGQGGQHARMGRALAARYPVFARALTAATDAIVAAGGPKVWTPRHGFGQLGADSGTAVVQPSVFAYQVALAQLFADWGVRPDAVIGHSLGEIAGAAVSGALTLADAARIAVWRSRCLGSLDGHGAMALLEAAPHEVEYLVEPMRASVGIAAVNGPRSVVVSGEPRYVETVVRRARRRDIYASRVAVDFAAHSPQVTAVLPEMVDALADLTPRTPEIRLYSTARRGLVVRTSTLSADYWADNASGTVELAAALELAADDGFTSVVEIAPHPVLVPAVREYGEFRESTRAGATRDDESGAFLDCVARLHTEGRTPNWSALGRFEGPVHRREWRRRYFAPVAATETATPADEFVTDPLDDHIVQGVPIVPAVYWLRRLLHLARGESVAVISDFVIDELTEVSALPRIGYHVEDGARLRVLADGARGPASARLGTGPTPADIVAWMRLADANRALHHRMHRLEAGYFYAQLRARHLEYGPRFRPLRRIATAPDRALGTFENADPHSTATLDGCLHLLAAACYDDLPDDVLPLPIGIESAWLSSEPDRVVLEGHALVTERTATGLVGDVVGTDQHGVPVLAMSGVRIRFTDGATRTLPTTLADTTALPAFRRETWHPLHPDVIGAGIDARAGYPRRVLVVGESEHAVRLARALESTVPTERVAREPDAATAVLTSALLRRTAAERIAVALVWPADSADESVAALGRILRLLQHVRAHDAVATLTVVLPEGYSRNAHATAALVRSVQLESGRVIRLAWADHRAGSTAILADLVTAGPEVALPEEIRVSGGDLAVRRFTLAKANTAAPPIDPNGTYVVTGGLGAVGAVAVRWLLDGGARDVVVLTRSPRPVPALLDGLEDRIVVVRCDAADRGDLDNALRDIRECGSTIRGVVHAAGALEDAAFDSVTPDQLARMSAPKVTAAADLLELTDSDPLDFLLLCSSATGALGAPGQAAYAAANAAMDAVAGAAARSGGRAARGADIEAGVGARQAWQAGSETGSGTGEAAVPAAEVASGIGVGNGRRSDSTAQQSAWTAGPRGISRTGRTSGAFGDPFPAEVFGRRRVVSVGWGVWESGLSEAAGDAIHLRRAGIAAVDPRRGAELLTAALCHSEPYLLAVDYAPTGDGSPVAARLRNLLTAQRDSPARRPEPIEATRPPLTPEPLTATVRRVLAATIDRPTESIETTADFNELGLSSLLAIELRRALETRLSIAISTAELFRHPTVAALSAALAERVAATDTGAAS
ncbi:type I polyketide synthase [Nocardia bovistercoris]|uniref:SDR family NAD(P)-dependent oxidoreductase n=1 Tax=Nocardia bovistercoris TaxID=2785916 RepID=A0A931IDT7_9NOCA|nr:type I polyketide synthase [Nocardia bovistercoris]MBH0778560.1 SDR family NAD(P)-dependent oxidoreductase [Nocardia bovistercoris]